MRDSAHRTWTLFLVIGICVAALPGCTGRSSDQPKADLTGEYRIISGERNGAAIAQDELNNSIIKIGEKTITAFDKERKETFAATYTIDTSRTPWHLTMISTKAPETGVIAKGLIQADQNGVKMIYALPNGGQPTEFKAGERQQMFVMVKTNQATAQGEGGL
jgi:uncharacterized protein (TIGR03067 family)